jgi:hypothetical protein
LSAEKSANGFPKDIPADNGIRHKIRSRSYIPNIGQIFSEYDQRSEQNGADQDAKELLFLTFCHASNPPFWYLSIQDLAVGFYFFAGFFRFFDDFIHLGFVCNDGELLHEEADIAGFDTVNFFDGTFHFFGAYGAVQIFELVNFFHDDSPFLSVQNG